jgi:predicted amidophosphoribosyltransferase
MIFELRCAGCDAPGAAVCTTCRFALLGPRPRPGAHGVRAAVPFTGRARRVVLGLKYRNRRQVARHLAGLVVNTLVANGEHLGLDAVTWAPTSIARRRARGFDQGELVARHVARQLGVPCRRLLERSGPAAPQTGRSRRERLEGPRFVARPGLEGRRVLVLDDVVTTGATMRAAAAALHGAGVAEARLYAVASTPAGSIATARPARPARPQSGTPDRPALVA